MARLALLDHSPKAREWGLGALQGGGDPPKNWCHDRPLPAFRHYYHDTVDTTTTKYYYYYYYYYEYYEYYDYYVIHSSLQVVWRWRRHEAARRTRNRNTFGP